MLSIAALRQRRLSDLVFLAVVVLFSVVPYATRLGFYSDDWAFLGVLLNAPDQSLSGLLTAEYNLPNLQKRPTQIAYQAVLFKAFGLNPLGYHFVNATVLASVALLLYLVLDEFKVHRTVALSVPAVHVLLPNYSTDRFWFAAFGYALSTALFLASSYAFLRAVRSQRLWLWTVFALLALAAAALGMEVVIPLALVIPFALWLQANRLSPGGLVARLGIPGTILLLGSSLAVVAPVVLYKATVAQVSSVPGVFYVVRLAVGSLAVNVGTYGIALPYTLAWGFRHLPFDDAALGVLLAGLVFAYVSTSEVPPQSRRTWKTIMLVGCGIFGLGTAIFLTTPRIQFWSTGIANRVWIAAAVGISMVLVGASGWLSSQLVNGAGRRNVFAALIATLCLSGFVINTALSTFWIAAWPRQLQVLGEIRRVLPVIAPRTTLILHEVCPYVGPAIVFESSWDLAGALQVAYRDQTLRADVTTGRFWIGDDGLSTRIYDRSVSYRYGHNLLLFNERRETAVRLTDSGVAHSQLDAPTTCPESIPGRGSIALPLDAWYQRAEVKGFRPWR